MLGKVGGPMLGDDAQEGQRPLPMRGKRIGHEGVHSGVVDVLDFHGVHQPGELARQPGGLRRRARGGRRVFGNVGLRPAAPTLDLGPSQHERGEAQLAPDLADGGQHLARTVREVERTGEQGRLLARADERPDLRQQQRAAARCRQESLLQRLRGPPGRQQQRHIGKLDRPRPRPAGQRQIAGHQRPGQLRQERPARRHRVDAPRRPHPRGPCLSFSFEEHRSGTAPLLPAHPASPHASTRHPFASRRRGPRRSPGSTPG